MENKQQSESEDSATVISLPKRLNDRIKAAKTWKWHEDLQACIQLHGPDHSLTKGTQALNTTKFEMLIEDLRNTLNDCLTQPNSLTEMSDDEVFEMAADLGFSNRKLGELRTRKILSRLAMGPATDKELGEAAHMTGEPLKQLLKTLKADGKIAEEDGVFTLLQTESKN